MSGIFAGPTSGDEVRALIGLLESLDIGLDILTS